MQEQVASCNLLDALVSQDEHTWLVVSSAPQLKASWALEIQSQCRYWWLNHCSSFLATSMSLQDLVMHSLCIKVWKAIRVITTILKGTTGRPSFWLPSIDVNLDPVGVLHGWKSRHSSCCDVFSSIWLSDFWGHVTRAVANDFCDYVKLQLLVPVPPQTGVLLGPGTRCYCLLLLVLCCTPTAVVLVEVQQLTVDIEPLLTLELRRCQLSPILLWLS